MAGPWEKYQAQEQEPTPPQEGPWNAYKGDAGGRSPYTPGGVETSLPRTVAETKLKPSMSDDEIMQAFGYDPAEIKSHWEYKPGQLQGMVSQPNDDSMWGRLKNSPVGGAIRGTLDPIDSGAQLLARGLNKAGLYSDAAVKYTELLNKIHEADYQQNWRQGANVQDDGDTTLDAGRLGGNMLMPVKGGGLIKGAGTAAKVGRAALTGGMAGATMSPVLETSPYIAGEGDDFWGEKGTQTALGAFFGPVGEAAISKVVAPAAGKLVNAARGVVDPALKQVQDLGQKYGVRMSVGDLTQSALPKRMETALESVPVVGTGGFRAAQHEEARAAAKGVSGDLREAMITTRFNGMDQVNAEAAKGNKAAIALKDELANAGDDWNKVVQASGNLKAFRTKLMADKLYGQVEQLAQGAGSVPPSNTQSALDSAIAEAISSKLPDEATINMLRKLKESIAGKAVEVSEPVMVGSGGAARTVRMPDNSFSAMRGLRSDLGDMISDYYKGGNALTGSKGVGLLQRVRSGVEQDMQDFALNSGRDDLASAWRRADAFYRARVVPFKDRALATALKDAPPDEVFGRFVQAGKGDRARNFYNALDPKGQAAVRYGMVSNAMDKAVDETGNVFSPAKFAHSMERLKDAQRAFFPGRSGQEIAGFSKLMRHIERAGQYAENPPTGQRTIPFLLGGAAMMNAPLAAKVAGVAAAARAMLTTEPGKRLLLASSKLEEGSPAMDKLVKRIEQVMPKLAGTVASEAAPDEVPAEP